MERQSSVSDVNGLLGFVLVAVNRRQPIEKDRPVVLFIRRVFFTGVVGAVSQLLQYFGRPV